MKKFLIISAILLSTIFALQLKGADGEYLLSYTPCDTPIRYALGAIDERFRLSEDDVRKNIAEATAIWNDYAQKPIFVEKRTDADVTISFVYDKRQALNTEVTTLEDKLDTDKASLDPQINAYNTRSRSFEQRVAKLNETIAYWNAQGGAPKEEYEKIKNEQQELEKESASLNQEAIALRQSTKDYNLQITKLNQTIADLKNSLIIKPEEGLYDAEKKTITIYLNNTRAELIHTLAHELGHSRDLGHVGDPDAIMYSNSSESVTLSSDDKRALDFVCQDKNYVQFAVEKYLQGVHQLRTAIVKQIQS
ncbi:MAG: matrixin family metalloprotease [Candidatus Levybacteria bacterium]|nr:matrixin family metalloprotease [Candidatus Levybacteria bacterium]